MCGLLFRDEKRISYLHKLRWQDINCFSSLEAVLLFEDVLNLHKVIKWEIVDLFIYFCTFAETMGFVDKLFESLTTKNYLGIPVVKEPPKEEVKPPAVKTDVEVRKVESGFKATVLRRAVCFLFMLWVKLLSSNVFLNVFFMQHNHCLPPD